MRTKIIKGAIVTCVILTGIVWYLVAGNNSEDTHTYTVKGQEAATEVKEQGEVTTSGKEKTGEAVDDSQLTESSSEVQYVVVYVCGEVNSPGVYSLPEGSRVADALTAAGGFGEEAATDYMNLARLLVDGEMLDVPSVTEVLEGVVTEHEESTSVNEASSGNGLSVNINTAGKSELMELPGIGESRAESIIEYREANGGFDAIEDIMNVSGIKEASFERLKDYIKVR